MQQFTQDRSQYHTDYNNYVKSVADYNAKVQAYRDKYGSRYRGYTAPSTIKAAPNYYTRR